MTVRDVANTTVDVAGQNLSDTVGNMGNCPLLAPEVVEAAARERHRHVQANSRWALDWEYLTEDQRQDGRARTAMILRAALAALPERGPMVIDRDSNPPTARNLTEADWTAIKASQAPEHLTQHDHECEPERGREVERRCSNLLTCGLRWTDKTGDDTCPQCGGPSELEPRR